MPLPEKHQRFVAEYLKDLNATKAAQRAGYSKRTARAQGSRLLTDADIKAAIAAGKADRAKRMGITQDRVLFELAAIAFANVANVVKVDDEGVVQVLPLDTLRPRDQRAIASIEQTKSERLSADGGDPLQTVQLKIKMHSKLPALRMLMDHMGMDAPKKTEHTGPEGGPIELKGLSFRELVDLAKGGGADD